MPVLQGEIAASPIGGTRSPAMVPGLSNYATGPVDQVVTLTNLGGSLINNLPVSVTPVVVQGAIHSMFGGDYLSVVRPNPVTLNVGFVVQDSTFQLKLWNGQVEAATLTSIQLVGAAGGINYGPAPGLTIPRLTEITTSVTVTKVGPAIINATLILTFSTGGVTTTVSVKILGSRARIWKYPIQWSNGFTTTRSYKTERFQSGKLREQRRALRNVARSAVEFRVQLVADTKREFQMELAGTYDQPFVYPMSNTKVALTTQADVGMSQLVVDEAVPAVVVGDSLHVTVGGSAYAFVVTNISGLTYSVSPDVPEPFPVGASVCKGEAGYLRSATSADMPTSNVAIAQIRFDAVPSSTPRVEPPAAATTHNGVEVFNIKPNWATQLQATFDREMDVIDYDRGQISLLTKANFGSTLMRMKFTAKNRAQAAAIDAVFDRAYGARGEFYCPTWSSDIIPAANLLSGGTTLAVAGSTLYQALAENPVYRNLYIRLTSGVVLMRKVVSITFSGVNSIVTVDQPWPSNITTGQIEMVSWLLRCTFASDILTWTWITDRVAETTLTVRAVEDLT